MEKEEAELLPSGLISCIIDKTEVRILKISTKKLSVRFLEERKNIDKIKIEFYVFDEYRYEEIEIKNYSIIDVIKRKFYNEYIFVINDEEYAKNVKRIFKDYSRYIMLKNFGEENEFSKEMVGYPYEKDYEFYDDYSKEKQKWISKLNYDRWNKSIMNHFELAVKLDNDKLYNDYLYNDINDFKDNYLRENYVNDHELFKKDISRIYIGNEFCHNLFPDKESLMNMLCKAQKENLSITLCFTYMRDCYIQNTLEILDNVYEWCSHSYNKKIEIVINDWGMLKILEDKSQFFSISLGVLLNKRKKDSRYVYKKGYIENRNLMAENSLNSSIFQEFLKEYKINRYEYENCGYKISIAEGKHSLQMPFYVTNTSQYCPLYAMCKNLDRGKQELVKACPKYCKDYVFAYPEHLKMTGRYNSLFAFDETLLKDAEMLEYYVKNGIDRIVLNFI